MSSQNENRGRHGFTLLELLVVLGILALLAALVIPKLTDTYERSRSATQAYSTADIARQLETYFALNHSYPDGWDMLMGTAGTIYDKLAPEVEAPNTFFQVQELTADQITSLNTAGIGHAFLHDATSAASNSGTDRRHFGTGTGHDGTANVNDFVVIDKTFTAGASGAAPTLGDGMDLLVNGFGLNPNRSATDSTFARITANTYVVLGLGPKSTLVQSTVHEAPLLEHRTSSSNYSRALAVFEVPNVGTTKARLVGIFGPDGRSKSLSIADYNSQTVQPH